MLIVVSDTLTKCFWKAKIFTPVSFFFCDFFIYALMGNSTCYYRLFLAYFLCATCSFKSNKLIAQLSIFEHETCKGIAMLAVFTFNSKVGPKRQHTRFLYGGDLQPLVAQPESSSSSFLKLCGQTSPSSATRQAAHGVSAMLLRSPHLPVTRRSKMLIKRKKQCHGQRVQSNIRHYEAPQSAVECLPTAIKSITVLTVK